MTQFPVNFLVILVFTTLLSITIATPFSCSTNICYNHGQCGNYSSGIANCTCPIGFEVTGPQCNLFSNSDYPGQSICDQATSNDFCGLNGLCLNSTLPQTLGNISCSCYNGYSGPNCTTVPDACYSNPCGAHGGCALTSTGYQCNCDDNWYGPLCIQPPCNCDQGYQCLDSNNANGFICVPSTCQTNPCFNDGICIEVETGSGYQCSCQLGWGDTLCDVAQSPCTGITCSGNGLCNATSPNSYSCDCDNGYNGTQCEDSMIIIPTECNLILLQQGVLFYFEAIAPSSWSGTFITTDDQQIFSPTDSVACLIPQGNSINNMTIFKVYIVLNLADENITEYLDLIVSGFTFSSYNITVVTDSQVNTHFVPLIPSSSSAPSTYFSSSSLSSSYNNISSSTGSSTNNDGFDDGPDDGLPNTAVPKIDVALMTIILSIVFSLLFVI